MEWEKYLRIGYETLPVYSCDELDYRVKLDANERGDDLPEPVRQAVIARLSRLEFNRYPDMGITNLRQLIAESYGLQSEQVTVGSGSSELLAALCFMFGGPDKKIICPQPSFSMYGVYTKIADSIPMPIMLDDDYRLDPEQVIAAAADKTVSLIILCNPNNPTGTAMPIADVERIVRNVSCPVVVDEAYGEFYGQSALPLLAACPNMMLVKTFSKAYGLASCRVGYMLASGEFTQLIGKALMPYHVNALSLAAAEAVYTNRTLFADSIAATIAERERVSALLSQQQAITVYPSATNFLLFKVGQTGPEPAEALFRYLAAKGIGIRNFSNSSGLTGCLRVTIGSPEDNDSFIAAVNEYCAINGLEG